MKIAIMATGGVGGVFGAKLAEAGEDVTFVARGAHLEAIRQSGLKIEGGGGETLITDAQATDDPARIGPVDVVIFAVKLWDTENAAEMCKPLLGDDTVVIPFQNGVGAIEALNAVIGPSHTAGGVSRVSASISAPGVIRQVGDFAYLGFAEADNQPSARMSAFLGACENAGIESEIVDDIHRALWQKFIFLVTLSGMTTAARTPLRALIESSEGLDTARACMTEIYTVGRARGVDLPDDTVEKLVAFGKSIPDAMKASQAIDLENGRRLEAPWLTGAVCDMGREAGIPTPVNDALYAVIKPFIMGNAG